MCRAGLAVGEPLMTLPFVDFSIGEGVALHPPNWVTAYDALSTAGPYEVDYR